MPTPTVIRLLYLGRNKKLLQQLRAILEQELQRTVELATRVLQVVQVTSQKRALDEIRTASPHGILIEIENGRYNRNRFCQMLRGRLPRVHIVAVHKDPIDYEFIFDGYIQRPLQESETLRVLSKLLDSSHHMYLQANGLRLDIALRIVEGPQGRYHLPPKLCKLLQVLMENPGKIVKREELMRQVWDTGFLDDTRTLDVHIRWLRERIEPDPSSPTFLHTVRGKGYRLNAQPVG